ncbi:DUF2313 domain-containing protein [Paenibacillus dendritiformis]|uniref:putative phage tail protein n=1 Tax=Paenibacillus dendritiformis TaxID=130049 RepID=UPI00248CA2EE|nr:putative phage tail protein [Paenibacillus dendritiformis]WGU94608.1 DUF2313 domain-containing protein [Paenibacillus dendritiformis]
MKLDDMRSRRGPIILGYLRKGFYQDSSGMLELLDTLGIEMDGVWGTFDDILDQCFVDRATWGLDIWEKELGLVPGPSDSDEIRRARIKAKLIGFGTFTEQIAQELANAYSRSGEARYLPLYDQYSFKTQYEDDDLISYAGLKAAFEEARPAHLKHLIKLLLSVPFHFEAYAGTRLKGRALLHSSDKWSAKSTFRSLITFWGIGRCNTCNASFDGTWQFDGLQTFDGIIHRSAERCLEAALPSQIKVFSRGSLPFSIDVKAFCKTRVASHFDNKIKDVTGFRMKAGAWFLGPGKYDDIDPEALLFHGWRFNGTKKFNGVNAEGLHFYFDQANTCYFRHVRNGQVIDEDYI